jgi:hypothetical protein
MKGSHRYTRNMGLVQPMRSFRCLALAIIVGSFPMAWPVGPSISRAGWQEHRIRQGDGRGGAANGDLVAALRTDMPPRYFAGPHDDSLAGTAISFSRDGGRTWSELRFLFDASCISMRVSRTEAGGGTGDRSRDPPLGRNSAGAISPPAPDFTAERHLMP